MTKKKNPIEEAKALLLASGYSVKSNRPDPRIGDVVLIASEGHEVLITFHQAPGATMDDVYVFGGVVVSRANYSDQNTDTYWIDRNEWAKDDGQYKVVGHVDLTKYTKIT